MSEEPDNTPAAIEGRIDRMIEYGRQQGHPPELLLLFDRVYRPFCRAMIDLKEGGHDPNTVLHCTALLLANLIKEMAAATSPFPRRAEEAFVDKIREILRSAPRGPSQLDSDDVLKTL